MTLLIKTSQNPSDAEYEAIFRPLHTHNIMRAGDPCIRPIAVLLTNEMGDNVGGLWGQCAYDWLIIEMLAIPLEYRGKNYGKALVEQAENIARSNDCIGVWLDTFEFQASGFYEKLGFEVFAIIDDHPIGQKRLFLRKKL
ncbi:GNAT family N-acetyltransferase [Novosphingobium aerophilum]|nr:MULTISPECIES: GNAT family N-acetyltransferase [unclassified Novosphingobium]KPH68630.1 GCN5 family acetyltransferase [Novosphingobium sp. ST904]TCM23018.1 acetyltransferase (GNAT) family protein [Novosphingobium sp. ST904]WRT95078.1 GNAT family N-acetyltransferase [Novosphingobium sp. RL4]